VSSTSEGWMDAFLVLVNDPSKNEVIFHECVPNRDILMKYSLD
jgi:hypothetical protein